MVGTGRRLLLAVGLVAILVIVLLIIWSHRMPAGRAQVQAVRGTVVVGGQRLLRDARTDLAPGIRLGIDEDGAARLWWPDGGQADCGGGVRLSLEAQDGWTGILDHGPIALERPSSARPLTVITPQARLRMAGGVCRIDARQRQTVATVMEGSVSIVSRGVAGEPRTFAAGTEVVLTGQSWEAVTTASPRIIPWSDLRIQAATPLDAVPVRGLVVHGQEVRRIAWSGPPAPGRTPAWNGVVWPLRLEAGEGRCAVWVRAQRIEVPSTMVPRTMTAELLIDHGTGQARLALQRLAPGPGDWMLLGGDIAKARPLAGGPIPRAAEVRAVALALTGGVATLELGPLLVQTPVP